MQHHYDINTKSQKLSWLQKYLNASWCDCEISHTISLYNVQSKFTHDPKYLRSLADSAQ